jgi:electron transfer flavoprotein alpha subunit
MAIEIDMEKCMGCGDCVSACPAEAIQIKNNKAMLDEDNCTECSVCVDSCFQQAIMFS